MNGIEVIKHEAERIHFHFGQRRILACTNAELRMAAAAILLMDRCLWPRNWNLEDYFECLLWPRSEQLAYAGALTAFEIDRLNYLDKSDITFARSYKLGKLSKRRKGGL